MQAAYDLAMQGQGRCAPNPHVGCVIVKNNQIITSARTADGGRPHAEPQALAQAGARAQGATLYVTLEPCSHHGQTPPCTEAIIAAGIARVVIAARDPFAKVDGSGIAALQQAGIEVELLPPSPQAAEVNRGFFSRLQRQRPWVTLKAASSADGFIAYPDGRSKWITGEAAREDGHRLRARNDAILTGSGTFLMDHPQLNVRLAGLENTSPQRYVFDRRGRLSPAELPPGWTVLSGSLQTALTEMARQGINYLMVEAGAKLSRGFLEADLADDLYWYVAPHKKLQQGIPVFDGIWEQLSPPPQKMKEDSLGADRLSVYRFTHPQTLIET